MLIALILVLVCTVVSIVIATSSSVDVERDNQYLKEQRAYYAVRSAMDSAEQVIIGQGPIANTALKLQSVNGTTMFDFENGAAPDDDPLGLATWIKDKANSIGNYTSNNNGATTSEDDLKEFDIEIDEKRINDTNTIPAVTVTLTMDPNYAITVTANLKDHDDGDYAYMLEETFPNMGDPSSLIYWKSRQQSEQQDGQS